MTNVVTKFEKVDRFLKFTVQEWTESALMKTSIYAYDLADKAFYKNGSPCVLDTFKRGFYNLSFIEDIAPLCNNADYLNYTMYVINRLLRTITNVGTVLDNLSHFSYLEKYFSAGLQMEDSLSSYKDSNLLDFISKPVLNFIREHKIPVNNQFHVFFYHKEFVNQFLLEFLKNNNNSKTFVQIIDLFYDNSIHGKYDYNARTYGPRISEINECVENNGLNLAKYVEYLVYITEHETASIKKAYNLHRDYLSMMQQLTEKRAYKKFKKYPFYLASIHDITAINKNLNDPKKYDFVKFAEIVIPLIEKYQYTGKEFSIVFPETPLDVIMESQNLAHCASGYLDSIINGNEIICFVRNNKCSNHSLLTMHITNGNTICHVRGFGNRLPTQEELTFIKSFALIKQLNLSGSL